MNVFFIHVSVTILGLTVLETTRAQGVDENTECYIVKSKADICQKDLQTELNQYQRNDRRTAFLMKLARYCVRVVKWSERKPSCEGVEAGLKRCNCDTNCLQHTKLSEYKNDVIQVCQNGCNQFESLLKRLDYCVQDLPIITVREGQYTDFCRSWKMSQKCVETNAIVAKCNIMFAVSMSRLIAAKQLEADEYRWLTTVAGAICDPQCKKHNDVLDQAQVCTRTFHEAISLEAKPIDFCRKLAELFKCLSQPTAAGCIAVEEVIRTIYSNISYYEDFSKKKCPDILSPPTTTTTTTPTTTRETTSSTTKFTATPELLIATTSSTTNREISGMNDVLDREPDDEPRLGESKMADGPWKPCKEHAQYHNGGLLPLGDGWTGLLAVVMLYVVLCIA